MSYSICNYLGCENRKRQRTFRFFRFPINENERCEKWIRNTGNLKLLDVHRQQLKEMTICEVHFDEACFVNETHHRLIRSAVPRLFKNPKEPLQEEVSQPKDISVLNDISLINTHIKVELPSTEPLDEEDETVEEKRIKIENESKTVEVKGNENVEMGFEIAEEKVEPEERELIETKKLLYSCLLYQTAEVLIPPNWCRVLPKSSDYVVFANFMLSECSSLVPYKEVCISSNGNVHYNCCGKEIITTLDKKFTTVGRLAKIIQGFDRKKVCEGSAAVGVDSFHTYKDLLGTWRDTLCPIILGDNWRIICEFCHKIGMTDM